MIRHLRMLYGYRELLWEWTRRDIKVRYKQSVLGAVWAILQPLALMVIFVVIFSWFIKVPSDGVPYPVFSYCGLLPWTFLAASIGFGVPSVVGNMNLVTKIYFPREVLPISAVAACFVDFLVASTVFGGMLVVYRMPVTWALVSVPVLLLIQVVLTFGLVLFASAVNVFYRDIRFVVPLAVQLWMYASPVIYPVSMVPTWILPLYMLNPMAGLIDGYRRAILHGQAPQWGYVGWSAAASLLIFWAGYAYFKRAERRFADRI